MNGALSGITAAVVGVVLNLSIWFGINAMFGRTDETHLFGAAIPSPDLATADWFALALAALSFLAMKYLKNTWFEYIPRKTQDRTHCQGSPVCSC